MSAFETICPGCHISLTLQDDENSKQCQYCRNTVSRFSNGAQDFQELLSKSFRLCNDLDFEAAQKNFEQLLVQERDNSRCAKALWGLICCKYGIQTLYEDGTNQRYIVCNKVNPEPVAKSWDYKRLIRLASREEKLIYEKDAGFVDGMQREFRRLRKAGEEFDVFLCYKETERYENLATGGIESRPSEDSAWVREIYEKLCEMLGEDTEIREILGRDIRVFYAPVTLRECRATDDYAASIAYALSTSRVTLVLGSKREYFESPWVHSEWTRSQKYIDSGRERIIIPVYRPSGSLTNDLGRLLPAELSGKQAYPVGESMPAKDLKSIADKIRWQLGIPDPMDPWRRNPFEILAERLKKKMTELNDSLRIEKEKLTNNKEVLEKADAELIALRKKELELQTRLDEQKTITVGLTSLYRAEEDRANKAEKDLKQAQSDVIAAKARAENAENDLKQAKKDLEEIRQSVTKVQSDLTASEAHAKRLQEEEIPKLNGQIMKLNLDVEERDKKNRELMRKIEEIKNTIVDYPPGEVQKLKEELERAQQKAMEAERTANGLHELRKTLIEQRDKAVQDARAANKRAEDVQKQFDAHMKTCPGGSGSNPPPPPPPFSAPIQCSGWGFTYDTQKGKSYNYGPDLRLETDAKARNSNFLYVHLRNIGRKAVTVEAYIQGPGNRKLGLSPSGCSLRPQSGFKMSAPFEGPAEQWCGKYPLFVNKEKIAELELNGNAP